MRQQQILALVPFGGVDDPFRSSPAAVTMRTRGHDSIGAEHSAAVD